MKKIFFLLHLILSFSLSSQNSICKTISPAIPRTDEKAHAPFLHPVKSHAAATYDINYHRCEWVIDPAQRYIRGAVTTYFKPTAAAFGQIQFDLDTIFTIDSVKYHNVTLSYSRFAPSILQI